MQSNPGLCKWDFPLDLASYSRLTAEGEHRGNGMGEVLDACNTRTCV